MTVAAATRGICRFAYVVDTDSRDKEKKKRVTGLGLIWKEEMWVRERRRKAVYQRTHVFFSAGKRRGYTVSLSLDELSHSHYLKRLTLYSVALCSQHTAMMAASVI